MLTLGFPKINSQYESPTVLDRLVTSVKAALPKDEKKEEEEESKNDSNNAQQQAYQVGHLSFIDCFFSLFLFY